MPHKTIFMLFFPNAKINLGLRVLCQRSDGYHDIATIMLPVDWCDILEMIPAQDKKGSFRQTGTTLDCPPSKNIVLKAIGALENALGHSIPPLDITLEKHIPFGAGLGGGSSDAAFAIIGANAIFNLGLDDSALADIAAEVGADCPFFIYNRPMLARGKGEILEPVECAQLQNCGLLIAKPVSEAVSTAEAYAGVSTSHLPSERMLSEAVSDTDIASWQNNPVLHNDFEPSVFALRPEISEIKQGMKNAGALYTAMSGSGAAVFGIFGNVKLAEKAKELFGTCSVHVGPALYTPQRPNVLPAQVL